MLKRGLSAAAVALVLLPGTAAAQTGQNYFYGELRGGATFLNDSELDDFTVLGVDFEQEFTYDTGWLVEGAFGYAHESGLRGEFAVGYRRSEIDKFRVEGGGTTFKTSVDGHIDALTNMVNLYYDFDLGSYGNYKGISANFVPFVGGGIGAAVMEIAGPDINDDDDTVFAWQVIGGFAYNFTPNMAATVSYAYFAASDPEFQGVDVPYDSHNVLGGLRFSF